MTRRGIAVARLRDEHPLTSARACQVARALIDAAEECERMNEADGET
ncbi:hypothetical protein [Candidatus Mycobacterium methanotrophicum]|uniref:Uncharacterized protein n=1 Tax=Candidatus Mycobacterium methanotrophicum TaxID=2943498 RepID=A0ABY4QN85_9MYCO|nr:hypothetical protein [Candidatus Mycobacterium methanotrophicum]UQX11316.1 hypothetical protein M5I08_01895 [Candidatus Mycobacterium methanotrophicum]